MYEWKLTFALLTKNADACEAVRAVKAHPDFRHVFTGTLPQAGQWDSDDAPEAVLQTDAAVAANAADDKRREAAQAEDGGDGLASVNSSSESGNGGEDEKCATDIGIKMHERLIVLADCDDPATLKAAVTQRGARVTVVAVAPLDAQLNEELYALCDAVWRLDPGLVEFRQRLGELLERLAFEREARLKQIWLLNLIDASPDLIWVKDLQGAHLEVNSTFCRTCTN